jgi:hypothetical protein
MAGNAGKRARAHKHLLIDPGTLKRARKVLDARTDSETVEMALALVIQEAALDGALKNMAGTCSIQRVFR